MSEKDRIAGPFGQARRHFEMHKNPFLRLVLALALVVTAVSAGTLTSVTSTHAAAALTLSRGNVAPGDNETASGTGFHPNDDVVVTTDVTVAGAARHVQVATTTDGNGNFKATLTIPAGTQQGTYTITAKDFHGGSASHSYNALPPPFSQAGGTTPTGFVIP